MPADGEIRTLFESIEPSKRIERFAQAWDADHRHVVYGLGDGEHGALIYGDGCIEEYIETKPRGIGCTRFAKSAPYRDAVDGAALFEQVRQLLTEYVYFDDARVADLVACWIMGTYLYTAFTHFGYLFFYSKFPRSGKTRILEIISHLAFEATSPLNAPTTATIRELAAEGKTLQLDTLERWKGKSAEAYHTAMELLDAGFRNGGVVPKMIRDDSSASGWRRETYAVYAPYSMAAIDRDSLSDTALDRSFAIEMKRKSISVEIARYNYHRFEAATVDVRETLYAWALQNGQSVAEVYEGDDFNANVKRLRLNDRAENIWKPILAIARTIGLDIQKLEALARALHEDPEAAEDRRRLAIVNELLARVRHGQVVGNTTKLSEGLDLGGIMLYTILSSWGFKQDNRRIDGRPLRVWVLPEKRLRAIVGELSGDSAHPPSPPRKSDYSDYVAGQRANRRFSFRRQHAYEDASEEWLQLPIPEGRWLPN